MSGSWIRPEWKKTDSMAELFYFIPLGEPWDQIQPRIEKSIFDSVPSELEIVPQSRVENPEIFVALLEESEGDELEMVFYEDIETVAECEYGLVLRGELEDQESLEYIQKTSRLITEILRQKGLGVIDLNNTQWYNQVSWEELFGPDKEFEFSSHINFIIGEEEEGNTGLEVHTRGMRKFARPDLIIHHVQGDLEENDLPSRVAMNILSSFAKYLIEGGTFDHGQGILLPNRENECVVLFIPDDSEDEDSYFNNELIEIVDLIGEQASTDLNNLINEIVETGEE